MKINPNGKHPKAKSNHRKAARGLLDPRYAKHVVLASNMIWQSIIGELMHSQVYAACKGT